MIVVKLSICPVYFLLPKVSVYCRHVFCNLCCANLTSTSLMHHAWVAGWNQFHANVQRWILFVFVWFGFYIKANGLLSPEFGGWSKLNCFFFSGCGEHGHQNTVIFFFHLHGLVIAMCQISMLLIMWSAAELWSLVRWWPELSSACYNLQVVVYSPAWQINRRITSQKLYLARWTQIRLVSAPYPAAVTPIMLLFFFEKLTPMLLQSPFPTPKDLHHSIDWHHHR